MIQQPVQPASAFAGGQTDNMLGKALIHIEKFAARDGVCLNHRMDGTAKSVHPIDQFTAITLANAEGIAEITHVMDGRQRLKLGFDIVIERLIGGIEAGP